MTTFPELRVRAQSSFRGPPWGEEMRYRRVVGPLALLCILAVSAGGLLANVKNNDKKDAKKTRAGVDAGAMDASRRAQHALNRLTFGARPGEAERVQAMGVDRWIELQLHPEKIDDGALQARLSGYRTLAMDSRELLRNFPPPFVLKAVEAGRLPMPSDPNQRAVYESQL